MIKYDDNMNRNLEEQWIVDRPRDDGWDAWSLWIAHLLDGVECEVDCKFERTYIHFAREEDMTWFILRWS